MDATNAEPSREDRPLFFPPLWIQRRSFVLNALRRETIQSAVELGCGEGYVLSVLCEPAFHTDTFPPSLLVPVEENGDPTHHQREQEAYDLLRQLKPCPVDQQELHLRRLAGLDISPSYLAGAQKATAQVQAHNAQPLAEEDPTEDLLQDDLAGETIYRWEPFRVDLWEGSLSVFNNSLEGYDAFIATEVIEHLDQETLDEFGNTVLGKYNPRLVVITTPNYDFNKYFPNEGDEEESPHSIPDPTGRTNRHFRDPDHKFEWTQDEFKEWIEHLSNTFDYSYELSGCGNLKYYRSVEDAPDPMYATQCAVLHRIERGDVDQRQSRSPMTTPLPFFSPLPDTSSADNSASNSYMGSPTLPQPHVLRASQQHMPASEAGNPQPPAVIRRALAEALTYMGAERALLRSLWIRERVAKACGGAVMNLIEAIIDDRSGAWSFELVDPEHYRGLNNVEIIWKRDRNTDNDVFMGPFSDLTVNETAASSSSAGAFTDSTSQAGELPPLFPELQDQHSGIPDIGEMPNPWEEEDQHLNSLREASAASSSSASAWDNHVNPGW